MIIPSKIKDKNRGEVFVSNIRKIVDEYCKKLNLLDFKINVYFASDRVLIVERGVGSKSTSSIFASVKAENPMCNSFDMIITEQVLNMNEQEIRDVVLHELAHILLWDYSLLIEQFYDFIDLDTKEKRKIVNKFYAKEHKLIDRLIKILR